jgi:hypothetical protein
MLRILVILLCLLTPAFASAWGFFGHQRINRLAVFTLPPEMMGFYKRHIIYLTENSTKPDSRRYSDPKEAPRHYIDLDMYGDSAVYKLPRYWKDAVAKYTEDTLNAYGIVPWHVQFMKFRLTEAMRNKDVDKILWLSADIGHYIADSNVPLHTTSNYNGQTTGQRGIHGLWESRLPELLADQYDYFVGNAMYLSNTQVAAWSNVERAHLALDSVFNFEKAVTARMSEDKKYSLEARGNTNMRVYSKPFSREYHDMLNGQVERQMRRSIKMVGNFWYTCWVDAGQPDLSALVNDISESEKKRLEEEEKQIKSVPNAVPEGESSILYWQEMLHSDANCHHAHASAKH